MMAEVVKVLKDRQVATTPLMIALCTHHVPTPLRDELLRSMGETSITALEGGKDGSGKVSSKASQRSQKKKRMKKLQKSKERTEDSTVPDIQVAPSGSPEREREQEKKKNKC